MDSRTKFVSVTSLVGIRYSACWSSDARPSWPPLLTAFLAWGLIYGHAGLPAFGAVGSAWAAAIGRIAGAAILLLGLANVSGWQLALCATYLVASIAVRKWMPQ